jgi:hypothetical protein
MFGQVQKGFASLVLICGLILCSPGAAEAFGPNTAKRFGSAQRT